MNRRTRLLLWLALAPAVVWVVAAACRPASQAEPGPEAAPPEKPQILDFPAELHADDQAVNAFLRRVIETCASGDYDAFRLLWSARDDPFPRDQFHRAWQSVQKVRIVALRPFREPQTGELLYAARAHVELDPSVREPQRDVTILLIRERGRWQLTTPPRDLPDQLFEQRRPTSQPRGASESAGAS